MNNDQDPEQTRLGWRQFYAHVEVIEKQRNDILKVSLKNSGNDCMTWETLAKDCPAWCVCIKEGPELCEHSETGVAQKHREMHKLRNISTPKVGAKVSSNFEIL